MNGISAMAKQIPAENVIHTFAIAGDYKVKLTVTHLDGCISIKDSLIKIGNVGYLQSSGNCNPNSIIIVMPGA